MNLPEKTPLLELGPTPSQDRFIQEKDMESLEPRSGTQGAEQDTASRPHETRLDSKGVLDEFVVYNPTNVHLERMDTNQWWIGVMCADGTMHHIRFSSKAIPTIETDEPL